MSVDDGYKRPVIPPLHERWKPPPPKDVGDADADTLYRCVGESLTIWENIEFAFCKMFGLFIESDTIAAERVYGTIIANPGKQAALKQAVAIFGERRGSKFSMSDFNLLLSHFSEGSARRNEIAHGVVMSFQINDESHGFFLTPAAYNSRKTYARTPQWWVTLSENEVKGGFDVFGQHYRYTSADIKHFTALFAELSKQAWGPLLEQSLSIFDEKFERKPDNQKYVVQLGKKPTDRCQ